MNNWEIVSVASLVGAIAIWVWVRYWYLPHKTHGKHG